MSRVAALLAVLLLAGLAGCGSADEPAGGRTGAQLVSAEPTAPAAGRAPANLLPAAPDPVEPATAGASAPPDAGSPAKVEVVTDRTAFAKAIGGRATVIGFDDVTTGESGETPFESDRYRDKGLLIRGEGGQYVGRSFGYPNDYVPVSKPNAYAAGPPAAAGDKAGAGGKETVVTFVDASGKPAAVAAFGADFVDADYPSYGKSALIAFDTAGREVARSEGFQGGSGKPYFVGVRATDSQGRLVAAIARVTLVTGNGWPGTDANEGVVLDDFTFTPPAAAGTVVTPSASSPAAVARSNPAPPNAGAAAGSPSPPAAGRSSPATAAPAAKPIEAKFTDGSAGRTVLTGHTPTNRTAVSYATPELPAVSGLSYSPDGKRLVSVADTSEAILWDLAGRSAKQLRPPGEWLSVSVRNRVAKFTADGRQVFVGSLGRADQFDATTGRLIRTYGKVGGVTSAPLLVSKDGRVVITAAEDRDGVEHYSVWAADRPEPVAEFRHKPDAGYTTSAFLTPDGSTAGVLDRMAGVRLFDTATGAERKGIASTDTIDEIALSADGRVLVAVDSNWAVRFWDISRRDAAPRILREAAVQSHSAPVFSPDGGTVAIFVNKSNGWGLFDTATGAQRGLISAGTPLFVSADGKTFVAGSAVTDAAARVRTTLDRPPYVAAVAPDGSAVAVGGEKGDVTLIPLTTLSSAGVELAATLPLGTNRVERGSYGYVLRLGNGGRYAAVGGSESLYTVVDLKTGNVVPVGIGTGCWTFGADGNSLYGCGRGGGDSYYFVGGQLRHVGLQDFLNRGESTVVADYRGFAMSPDGKMLAAAIEQRRRLDGKNPDNTGRLVLLDPRRNPDDIAIVGTLAEGFVPVLLAFSPDGKRLAAEDGRKLRLWDLAPPTGRPEEVPNAFEAVAYAMWFSSDGKSLVTFGGNKDAAVWDLESGQLGRKLTSKAGHVESVWGMAVSPAGPVYATFGGRGELLLKSLADDAVLARATAGDGPVVAGAFSADGNTLVTLGADGGKDVVKVWGLSAK